MLKLACTAPPPTRRASLAPNQMKHQGQTMSNKRGLVITAAEKGLAKRGWNLSSILVNSCKCWNMTKKIGHRINLKMKAHHWFPSKLRWTKYKNPNWPFINDVMQI